MKWKSIEAGTYDDQRRFYPEHRIRSKVRISLEIEGRRQAFIPWSVDADVQMRRPKYMSVEFRNHSAYGTITRNGIRHRSEIWSIRG